MTAVACSFLSLFLSVLLQPSCAVFHHKGPKDAYNGYKPGDTTIIDEFGQPALLEKLSDPDLWVTCDEKGKMWMNWGTKPKNIWQALNILIWKDHPEIKMAKTNNQSFAGFEFWCNRTSNRSPFEGAHWQVIIDDANETQPHMGAVYFGFPHTVKGGMMDIMPSQTIFDIDMDEPYRAKYYALDNKHRAQNVHHVDPEFNRLVTFNSSRWHGVHMIKEGWRFQFVTNLWAQLPREAPPEPTPEQVRKRRLKKLTKAYKNYEPGDTTIIDDFGEDNLMGKIKDGRTWDKCIEQGRQWLDWDAKPNTVWQLASKLIWQVHPEVTAAKSRKETFAGYEYWCVKMDEYERNEDDYMIPFHRETDEAKVSHPVMGAHFLAYKDGHSRDIAGGMLKILKPDDPSVVTTKEEAEAYASKEARQKPGRIKHVDFKYNRLVTFNATNWHAVTGIDMGEYGGLMVNLWKEKPKTLKDLKISSYNYNDSDDEEEDDESSQHEEL